jgi:N-acetyl-alpha-D-muramate 1-phosphate uridylyltransferase
MIVAAGRGTRMRPLTDHTPKPLLVAGGKPLLQYHLEALHAAGVREVIINLAWLGDQIRAFAGDGSAFGLSVCYSEEPEPLETGGAILRALPLLGTEPFVLINGDVWCDYPLKSLCARSLPKQVAGHLVLVPNPPFHPKGDFALDADGKLVGKSSGLSRFTFAGISVLRPELIRDYPQRRDKFPLVEVLFPAIDAGHLSGELYRGGWSDVGTPERLNELDAILSVK